MSENILVALITAFGSIIGAIISANAVLKVARIKEDKPLPNTSKKDKPLPKISKVNKPILYLSIIIGGAIIGGVILLLIAIVISPYLIKFIKDYDFSINSLPSADFSNTTSGWGTGTDSFSSVEYLNDGLTMLVFKPFYVTWSTPDTKVYENVHLEVDILNQSSDDKALFGFICNEQGTTNAFYYVGVSPDGYYAFIKSSVVGDDVYLKEDFSDVVTDNLSSLRLGLDCANGSMALYVNGQKIDSVSDSSYTSGSVGLFLASNEEPNGAAAIFDNFVMTKLGE